MDWQDDPHQCGSAQSVGARELVRVCRTGAVLSWERVSLLHWRSYCGQFSLFYPSAFPLSGTATALGCGVWGVGCTTDLSGYCCYRKERRGGKIYLGSRFKVAVHVVEGAWW